MNPGSSTLRTLRTPILIPLDRPWIDGARYRPAGATDARNRLDLYLADPAGPWIRLHGTLLRVAT